MKTKKAALIFAVLSLIIALVMATTLALSVSLVSAEDRFRDGVLVTPEAVPPSPLSIGEVIYTVPSPETNYTDGLAWDGTALWVCGGYNGMIYRFDPFTATVLTSFLGPTVYLRDLAWDGANLWVTSWDYPRNIYKLNPSDGSVIASFPAPFSGHPVGLAWDGNYLWVGEEGGKIYAVDPSTGLAVYSFSVPPEPYYNPRGLAWDGENIWTGYQYAGLIKEHDITTGAVLTSFSSPSDGFQQGLAWDGSYLWSTGGDNYIYQIDVIGASFDIWTDKSDYFVGETMNLFVRVQNPGSALPVRAVMALKLTSGSYYFVLDMETTLPAGFDSGDVLYESFTIPSAPLGTYVWTAVLLNPSTGEIMNFDTWKWTYWL